MLDEPCTRSRLKSCLKVTPPITPELSAAPSPCTSGRTSPSVVSDSGSSSGGGRKTVAFCDQDELEEIFFADEWDRTPAAVTPKLSYQDILELKQLRINLPHHPPPPPPRQPFTTSLPTSSKPPFPLSRFANTVSHTPSKWKNRSEPQRHDVDPTILPYLDAVPIRLLPLLPQSPTESEPPPSEPPEPPEPHPQTPTPTASPEARPTIQSPSDPPELRIVEPIVPVSAQSVLTPSSVYSPPQVRKPNFSFLPLLPMEDTPSIPSAPLIQSAPTPPRKKFNMTFLPVNAVPDSESTSYPIPDYVNQGTGAQSASAPLPSPASSVGRPNPPSPDAGHLTSGVTASEVTSLTPTTSISDKPSMSPPPLQLALPATSPLPIAIESDTDTDTYTDTDAESDAPSTSTVASSVPSPPCEFEDGPELNDLKIDPGSYFPPPPLVLPLTEPANPPFRLPARVQLTELTSPHSAEPGGTPPLGVLFPSPRSRTRSLPPLDAIASAGEPHPTGDSETPIILTSFETDSSAPPSVRPSMSISLSPDTFTGDLSLPATPLSVSLVLQKKLTLEALPSPALVPPSPFELEPNQHRGASPKGASEVAEKLEVLRVSGSGSEVARPDATPVVKAAVAGDTPGSEGSPSPMLTLENVRASWDATAREGIAVVRSGAAASVLGPSLSRRRSS